MLAINCSLTIQYETTLFTGRCILIFTSGNKQTSNSEHENGGACSSSGKSHRELALTDHVHLYDDVFANFVGNQCSYLIFYYYL